MKSVFSMQQIVSPSSHNQTGFSTAKQEPGMFAKTFHLQPTAKLLPHQIIKKELFEAALQKV